MVRGKKIASAVPTAPKFVVGVDFGTTFTSVAFAHSDSPEEVKLVQTWPKGATSGRSADQVPTEVHYTNPQTRTKLWGYELSNISQGAMSPDPLKWFKLLLQEKNTPTVSQTPASSRGFRVHQRSPERPANLSALFQTLGVSSAGLSSPAQETAQKLRQIKITPLQVVEDFLASVRELAVAEIGTSYQTKWVQGQKIEYVLSIPAIWSDAAKNLMVRAAEAAGYGIHRDDFNLVSEPESAAAYTLKVIQPNDLNCGDTFIVCDAGGGTVDLISYKITNLKPLRLDESVSGTGDLCGSVFLDQRFEQYIRGKLGDKVINAMKPRSKATMMRSWESIKFMFGNSSGLGGYDVNVPGVPDDYEKKVDDSFHSMEGKDVQKIFDPFVDRIVKLVTQQVLEVQKKGENVAAILLVGGFGSSKYLLKRLQDASYGGEKLEVLQPVNAQTAIARGALLRGLDGSIVRDRRSRRFYGCKASSVWFPGQGTDDHRYWDSRDDSFKVSGHLSWYIKHNMILGDHVSTSIGFFRLVPIENIHGFGPDLVFTDDLLACDKAVAPDYEWQDEEAVYQVCPLRSDLTPIPYSKFQRTTNSMGEQFYKINFQLRLTLLGEVLKFESLFDGKVCGQVTAQYKD
ncbi:actin-like ATPase domain-containing protein [Wilcoxina mikolae CBS 423.85]|nr:actin-like ATPase domain-containing protein [Wilcoxina mikolae CBS 423.85]